MNRPKTLDDIKDKEVLEYIESLELEISKIKENSDAMVCVALVERQKHLTGLIKSADVSELAELSKEARQLSENIQFFKDRITKEQFKVAEKEFRDDAEVEMHVFTSSE